MVKVTLFVCCFKHHTMTYLTVESPLHAFLTSASDGGLIALPPGYDPPSTQDAGWDPKVVCALHNTAVESNRNPTWPIDHGKAWSLCPCCVTVLIKCNVLLTFVQRSHVKCVIGIQSLCKQIWVTRWRTWLRHCTTSRKVAGFIPDGVTGIFH